MSYDQKGKNPFAVLPTENVSGPDDDGRPGPDRRTPPSTSRRGSFSTVVQQPPTKPKSVTTIPIPAAPAAPSSYLVTATHYLHAAFQTVYGWLGSRLGLWLTGISTGVLDYIFFVFNFLVIVDLPGCLLAGVVSLTSNTAILILFLVVLAAATAVVATNVYSDVVTCLRYVLQYIGSPLADSFLISTRTKKIGSATTYFSMLTSGVVFGNLIAGAFSTSAKAQPMTMDCVLQNWDGEKKIFTILASIFGGAIGLLFGAPQLNTQYYNARLCYGVYGTAILYSIFVTAQTVLPLIRDLIKNSARLAIPTVAAQFVAVIILVVSRIISYVQVNKEWMKKHHSELPQHTQTAVEAHLDASNPAPASAWKKALLTLIIALFGCGAYAYLGYASLMVILIELIGPDGDALWLKILMGLLATFYGGARSAKTLPKTLPDSTLAPDEQRLLASPDEEDPPA